MRRRTLLAALCGGLSFLAGCGAGQQPSTSRGSPTSAAPAGGSSTPTDACRNRASATPKEGTATVASGERRRVVRLDSVDPVPDASPLVPSVDVVEPAVTDAHSARVRIAVRNEAARPVQRESTRKVFGAFTSDSRPRGGIVLLPPRYEPVRPGCWRTALDERSLIGLGGDVVEEITYRACERAAVTRTVFGHPEATACLPTGTYRFVDWFGVYDEGAGASDGDPVEFEWGFTLAVDGP